MNSSRCSVLGPSALSPQLGVHLDLITASWAMLGFILFVSNFSGIMIFHCMIASVLKILVQYILSGFLRDRDISRGRVNLALLTLSWLEAEILSYLVFLYKSSIDMYSLTIQFIYLKSTYQWFSVSQSCATIIINNFTFLSHQTEISYSLAITLPFLLLPLS